MWWPSWREPLPQPCPQPRRSVRWAVVANSPSAGRTERCWHAAALGGGRLWPSSAARAPAPAPRSPARLAPAGCVPGVRQRCARRGSSCPGWDGPGQLLLRFQVGCDGVQGHVGTAGPRSSGAAHGHRTLLCREVLTDAEPVLSADVGLTWGHKRSERRLLLLPEELVVAKLQ